MNILLIVDYYYPAVGGAETLYQELAEGLVSLGHTVTLLTQGVDHALIEEVVNGVKVFRVATLHRALFPYQAFKLAKKLAADAHIVQAGPYSSGILAARLRKHTQAKIILSVYEYLGRRWLAFGSLGLQAFLYEKYLFSFHFDHYVAISESTKGQLLGIGLPEERVSRIYCGVDAAFFHPRALNLTLRKELGVDTSDFVYLYAGRPGVTKGIWTLLGAIAGLPKDCAAQGILLLAKQPKKQRSLVEQYIRQHGLEERVKVLDSVPRKDLPEYLAIANVIVVPSRTEGFGFFAAEVSAMQIPLIVSKVDALPEVVSGKVIFVEPGDVASIVAAIGQAQRGEFGHLPAKLFSWDDTCREYEKLYQILKV